MIGTVPLIELCLSNCNVLVVRGDRRPPKSRKESPEVAAAAHRRRAKREIQLSLQDEEVSPTETSPCVKSVE